MRSMAGIALALVLMAALLRPAHGDEIADRVATITRLAETRAGLDREQRAAQAHYQANVAEVGRLKAQPTSWNRDRKLETLLGESKGMAQNMLGGAERLRAVDAALHVERKALLSELDRELGALPGAPMSEARRTFLLDLKTQTSSQIASVRRLVLTDESIDPLDDPEDLEEKAASLAASEATLRKEEQRLGKRAAYFQKQSQLERNRRRASEADVFQDDQPRRVARSTTQAEPESKKMPTVAIADPARDGETTVESTILLSDLIEPGTLSELQRAERSGNPETRAQAAEKARLEIKARAERLRLRRLDMERRAQELRRAH